MTSIFTVVDLAQNRRQVLTAATEADALKLVYETLVSWNHDETDCSAAIEKGFIGNPPSGSQNKGVTYLDFDPAGFWSRCADLMLGDNQDFFVGEISPWDESDEGEEG